MTFTEVEEPRAHGGLRTPALLMAVVIALVLGFSTAPAQASPSGSEEVLVHVVLPETLDAEALEQAERAFQDIGSPRPGLKHVVLEIAVRSATPDLIRRAGNLVLRAREEGWEVIGMTAVAPANEWTALTLLAVGGDLLVEPFRSFRGSTRPASGFVRSEIEELLVTLGVGSAQDRTTQDRVALLAALFDPDVALSRSAAGVELGTPDGAEETALTGAGQGFTLDSETAVALGSFRWLSQRDRMGVDVLGMAEGEPLRWVAPDDPLVRGLPADIQVPEQETATDEAAAPIVRMYLREVVDEGMVSQVRRGFSLAREQGAALVVLDLETPGGKVISMNEILDHIDRWREDGRPVVAFVNDEAISAGMVIALGCDEIFMKAGASIGAATPVVMGPGGITAPGDDGRSDSDEKIMSYFRASVRTLAQKTRASNRNAQLLAEAMVDPQIALVAYRPGADGPIVIYPQDEYDKLVQNDRILPGDGKEVARWDEKTLVTLTTREAVDFSFATAEVKDFEDLQRRLGMIPGSAKVLEVRTNWSEELIRMLGAYSFLIFLAACVLAYVEFKIPGFGVPGIGSILCFSILFLREYLGGMAEVPEILLFFLGAGLIAVEIFLFPGTVIFGVVGALCALIGLYLSFHNFAVPETSIQVQQVQENLLYFVGGIGGAAVFGLLFARYLPSLPILGRLISLPSGAGPGLAASGFDDTRHDLRRLIGQTGIVVSDLHPGGRIRVGEEYIDATCEGQFLERGATVRVTEAQSNRVIVAPVSSGQRSESSKRV